MKAEASNLALAAAALRSSSDLPIFFWLRSRAAWAFWTLEPFPMFGSCFDESYGVHFMWCNGFEVAALFH